MSSISKMQTNSEKKIIWKNLNIYEGLKKKSNVYKLT